MIRRQVLAVLWAVVWVVGIAVGLCLIAGKE